MVQHWLACFARETARPPLGLESLEAACRPHPHPADPHEIEMQEAACRATLAAAAAAATHPDHCKLQLLGHGCGFSFEATPFCSYATRDGVHVIVAGEVAEWPGISAVAAAHDAFMRNEPPPEASDAAWLLDFYSSFIGDTCDALDTTHRALECLAQVKGAFSFVIFDETQQRVFAARDAEGSQPLYWGATADGQLLLGSNLNDMEGCDPTATAFPPGTLFASTRHTVAYSPGACGWVIEEGEWPGQLLSFLLEPDGRHWRGVKAIPRITPTGQLLGAVYRVASSRQLPVEDDGPTGAAAVPPAAQGCAGVPGSASSNVRVHYLEGAK